MSERGKESPAKAESKSKGWGSWAAAEVSRIYSTMTHCSAGASWESNEVEQNVLHRPPFGKITGCAQKEHWIGSLGWR